ncbi:hypothetical protein P9274_20670, partial [Schinkia azotoformans]|nr:hypothetical protein [Schinkia azotoformans]
MPKPSVPKSFPKPKKMSEEIPGRRKGRKFEMANPDDSITTETFVAPVFWKNEKGMWKDIQNQLIQTTEHPNFKYKNQSNKWSSWFSLFQDNQVLNRVELGPYKVDMKPLHASQ